MFYNGRANIFRVIDGDTFASQIEPWPHVYFTDTGYGRIRLVHRDGSKYDAPEISTNEGKAAKAYAMELLAENSTLDVGCKGIDSFGRSLCYVTLPDGRDMAAVMTAAGHVKGEAMVQERKLDRLYEEDPRSGQYPLRLLWSGEQLPALVSKTWDLDVQLDQGSEGACVGFGFSQEAAAAPEKVFGVTNSYAHNWYCKAQLRDPWPGGACTGNNEPYYEGTSTLAGAKVGVDLGNYTSYLWADNEEDIARTVGNYGPVVMGVNWYEGMMNTDAKGFIWPAGEVVGGHCVVVIGFNLEEGYYIIQNSWGPDWGMNGRCYLHRENMARLLDEDGDVCVLTRVHIDPDPVPPTPPAPKNCSWWTKFLNWISGGKFECPKPKELITPFSDLNVVSGRTHRYSKGGVVK